ncbi:unnamed protein product [Caenorhabditis brenneri]
MSEEKDPFKFDSFLETIKPKNKMATKKEIDQLLIFIGGFEKWPVLIEDCRREVVKYLDYKSRCNLGICSKDDHETVEKTKIGVASIVILDRLHYHSRVHDRISIKEFDNVTVQIRFPNGHQNTLVFSQLKQDTRVQWLTKQYPAIKTVIWKSCNYYEEAVKFAEKWMKKSNFELEAITVGMAKYPFASSQIKLLPCCRIVKICAYDVDSFGWWLEKCSEQIDDLQLVVYSEVKKSLILPSDFLNAPRIMQASEICFFCRAAFSDEQLLKLRAKSIYFNSVDVTDKGINEFIKNWAKGKGVNGFKNLKLMATSVRDLDVMFAGLNVKEWDEAFENEHRRFVENFNGDCTRGRRYQIKSKVDPFESLTLNIHATGVSIFATGKRVENNGEPSTCYQVPRIITKLNAVEI